MSSAYITSRLTKSGPRFIVRYRLGGRDTPLVYAGVFKSREEAETLRAEVAECLAARKRLPPRPDPPLRMKRGQPLSVYFGQIGPLVKVGVSVNHQKRASALGVRLLHVEPGGRQRERRLHRLFADSHVSGEWFYLKGQLRRYLKKQGADISRRSPPERSKTIPGLCLGHDRKYGKQVG